VPINILNCTGKADGEKPEKLDWLCAEDWELPSQIKCLDDWLVSTGKNLRPGAYVADIGFSPREGAFGGGGVLTHKSMAVMASIGMNLFLSEYPSPDDDSDE
jgi:hypothetical protein